MTTRATVMLTLDASGTVTMHGYPDLVPLEELRRALVGGSSTTVTDLEHALDLVREHSEEARNHRDVRGMLAAAMRIDARPLPSLPDLLTQVRALAGNDYLEVPGEPAGVDTVWTEHQETGEAIEWTRQPDRYRPSASEWVRTSDGYRLYWFDLITREGGVHLTRPES